MTPSLLSVLCSPSSKPGPGAAANAGSASAVEFQQLCGVIGKYTVDSQGAEPVPFVRVVGGVHPAFQAAAVRVLHQRLAEKIDTAVEGVGTQRLATAGVIQGNASDQNAPF